MVEMKRKSFTRFTAILMGIAMMLLLLPAMKTQAATAVLAEPKDAAQTVSTESGVRVAWSKVTGATQYFYSFSVDNKTYTTEALTGNNGTDTFVDVVNKDVMKAGTTYYVKVRAFNGTAYSKEVIVTVATAPKAPATIKQTAAENGSVTVEWGKSEGATGYLIKFGATQAAAKDIQTVTTTSCKLTGLSADSAYYIAVYPVRKVSASFSASYACVENPRVVTTAGEVTGLKTAAWDVKSNIITLQWTNAAKYESGYQIELYKADGTTLMKTYNVYGARANSKTFSLKAAKNTPFQYRIRTYKLFNDSDGKQVKSYGAWSAFAYAIPQGNVTAKKASDTSVKLSWGKVNGAYNYTIYRATSEGGKFKKVGTTKKNNYTVKNLKTYKDYYFYVRANKVTIGGKKRNSTTLAEKNAINVYIYKYQDIVSED